MILEQNSVTQYSPVGERKQAITMVYPLTFSISILLLSKEHCQHFEERTNCQRKEQEEFDGYLSSHLFSCPFIPSRLLEHCLGVQCLTPCKNITIFGA